MDRYLQQLLIEGSKGGKGGGGGGGSGAVEDPNTLQSKSILRVVEVISEGECEGLVDGAKSIFLDETPLQNADLSFNFTGINYHERKGTPDQDYIEGFTSVEEEFAVGVKVTQPTPIVRTITDADTDAVRVTIRFPALTEQNTTNGNLSGSSVNFKIEYQPNGGGYIEAVNETITGKTTSPYEIQYRVDLTGSEPWNIRVTRITADNMAANIQNDMFWSTYTRLIDEKLIYPDSALMGLEVDSELFGSSIPTRSFDWKGIKMQIPSNYNPTTRVYTGNWDGTFQTAYSDNPAWVLYDLLTNNRYGLGQHVDAAEVDKFGLYTIAQYCDELVDDGFGGTEPRFVFNGVIEDQAEALKVLQTVASVFRGMLYWGAEGSSGIITAVQDSPKDAKKIFTNANVIDGFFDYSGSALNTRHSVIYVTWNDPNNAYKRAVEVVEDPALVELFGFRKTDVVAYGCTSRGQAHRTGKWILDTEANETELAQFKVSIADADLRPGNIIEIQDEHYADTRFGGRVVSATTTSITIDSSVTLSSGQSYTIAVMLPNGELKEASLTNSLPGSYTVLTLGSTLPIAPEANAMWVITATNLSPRPFRVLSLREVNDIEYEVTALFYDANKYARVEQDLNLPPLTFTTLQEGVISPPTNVQITEYLYQQGVAIQSAVSMSWEASPDGRVIRYEAELKKPGSGETFQVFYSGPGITADFFPTFDGTWDFRVRAFDSLGNFSTYASKLSCTLSINGTPPDDVTNFNITPIGTTAELSWTEVSNLNLDHYEIRYNQNQSGATWGNSIVLIESVPKGQTQVSINGQDGTYLIKAVTIPTASFPNGVYSVNATSIVTNVNFLLNFNFIQTVTEDPGFTGTKTQVVVDLAGNLELEEEVAGVSYYSSGTYEFANSVDLGDVYTSRLTANITVSGDNLNNNVDDWVDVDLIANVDGTDDDQWDVQLELRTTPDDPAGSPTWSPWQAFVVGDYNARAFEFRIQLFSLFSSVTPSIETLSVTIDMPDIIQSGDDIVVPVNGTTITFANEFRNSDPAIAIAAQNLAQGDYWVITNKLATGFDIEFFDSSDTSISRTFDYVAKGYGFVT